jgi:hypothetical protein
MSSSASSLPFSAVRPLPVALKRDRLIKSHAAERVTGWAAGGALAQRAKSLTCSGSARRGDSPGPHRRFPHDRKTEDHDIRVPILGMGHEVAFSRRIRILFKATSNLHDLPRTVPLPPPLYLVNCVREPADEGCVDHRSFPDSAKARPAAVSVLANWNDNTVCDAPIAPSR